MKRADKVTAYRCLGCGEEYPVEPFLYVCAACGGNLDLLYDYERISKMWSRDDLSSDRNPSLWRFLPLLPVDEAPAEQSLQVGGTPLVSLPCLKARLDLDELWVKDDTRNPSASLKDRASEVTIQHASELGHDILVGASTGNAAASLAALCAYHRKRAVILAPASAPVAKLTQILQYGAELCSIEGSYDEAFELSLKVVERFGWYSRSTGYNPVLSEGKKTVALEIAEQLDWKMPDYVLVPVGDGCIIGGVYKGLYDLLKLGWIEAMPKIVAVQAEGSAAIVNALAEGGIIKPVASKTVADSISVDMPRDGLKAVRAVQGSDGFGIVVSDDQILSAQKELAGATGIFAEPAGAAPFAALLKARAAGLIDAGASVVLMVTGSGLKNIEAALRMVRFPTPIPPDLEAFEAFMDNRGGRSQ